MIYGRDSSNVKWNTENFTATTSWSRVTTDRNGLSSVTDLKKINFQTQNDGAGELYIDDVVLEDNGY